MPALGAFVADELGLSIAACTSSLTLPNFVIALDWGDMSEEPTCGRGLAEHAALPASLAKLLAAVGRNLELHLDSLDPADESSRPEYAAYTTLVQLHRELATRLRATADLMESFRDLPMADHDPEVLGSAPVIAAFRALVDEEDRVIELLRAWVDRDRAVLGELPGTAE